MVRAGKYGEQEATLIENNIVAIGWNKLPDLFNIKSKENLKTIYKKTYPDRSKNLMNSQINQIWRYIRYNRDSVDSSY